MSSFTHHNCCINLVDAVIELNESNYSGASLLDLHDIMDSTKTVKELDDNVPLRKSVVTKVKHHPSVTVGIDHPKHLKFVPIRLDYRDHLSTELRAD